MNWFTHFTRPVRRGLAPNGRNHVRRDSGHTLCGIGLERWMANRVVILDPLTGDEAYPSCKRCVRLSSRRAPSSAPALAA